MGMKKGRVSMLEFGVNNYVMMIRYKILILCILVVCSPFEASAGSIGAIVDSTSSRDGKEERIAMEMAIQDFYSSVPSPRLALHVMDSENNPFKAASSAKKLIQSHNVSAIIGLDQSEEAAFVAELGSVSHVPILSLANNIPPSASKQWPFLVNMARSQQAQMKAVAAIVQSWQWRKVTLIYEDKASIVDGIFPYLIEALREVDSDIEYYLPLQPFSRYSNLSEKLMDLIERQSRVFIVHASRNSAINLFMEAKRMGMMEKEFVWITTNCIISRVSSLNASTISAMQGVLGVTGFSPSRFQREYKNFSKRFKTKFRSTYPNESYMEPGDFALIAYDAVYATVFAIEGKSYTKPFATLPNHHAAVNGHKLLIKILKTKFKGLSGEVDLNGGTLAPSSIFQIVNVIGKSYIELGYWSEGLGFSVNIDNGSTYSDSMKILGQVNWPGRPLTVPKGWAVPTSAKTLKIGVPGSNSFPQFMDVRYEQSGGVPIVGGLAIDVFKATVENLPYNLLYEFIPYNGTYDSLVQQVYLKVFDAVVGDTNIVANRCQYADFSQPYSDAGLQVLVYTRLKTSAARAWLFKKPFTTWTWVSTAAVNLYSGFVVWFIERHTSRGSWLNQCGTIIWLAFTTLFTALQGDKLHSNASRMAAVIWLFVALVITSSYTASLTSLLTIQNLNSKVIDVETLRSTGAKVGCNGNSFVVKYLQDVLNIQQENIERIYSEDDYPQALKSGKIAAAFLEVPYLKVFLAKNCIGFRTGETFKVGGFGFVFPKGDPLLSDISKAVLNVSENGKLRNLENAMLSSYKCSESDDDHDGTSLGFDSFWGLFAITAGASTIALVLYLFPLPAASLTRWPNFSNRVNDIETEQEHHLQQKQKREMQNVVSSSAAETQHDAEQDEKFLFVSEMENQ